MTGTDDLGELARRVLALGQGGEQVEVVLARSGSTSVKVHAGEVESFTSATSHGAGVRVIVDGRVGFAHAGTLDPRVLSELVAEARENVAFAEPDEFQVLARPDGVAAVPHPEAWQDEVLSFPTERKVDLALELERQVRSRDPRISSVRVSAFSDGWAESVLVSSEGMEATGRGTHCSIGVQPLASEGDETQVGYGYDVGRTPRLLSVEKAAAEGAERATRLLGAVRPATARLPIVLEPRLAATLFGIVAGMLNGESVAKGRTPFGDRRGEEIAGGLVTLVDDPTDPESYGAEEFDGEGLACRRNVLISGGRLEGFLHNTYSAGRCATISTASAVRGSRSLPGVGAMALRLEPGSGGAEELIAGVGEGVFVNSFTGLHSGVNGVSGDFSVGADGLMIRDGALAEPVRELTLASTIQRMLIDVVAVGADLEYLPGGSVMPTVVIDQMAIGGR